MKRSLLLMSLALLVSSCGVDGTGTVTVLLTDAPATEATSLNVTFGAVELIPRGDGEAGVVTIPSSAGVVDVLSLRNGGLETLGELAIPTGEYGQLRLIVDEAEIVFGEGDTAAAFPVKVPSGPQSGLKIGVEPPLVALAGRTSIVTLDIDVARAVIETPPGSGNYTLKPTGIRAVTASGTLTGVVVDAAAQAPLAGAVVSVSDESGVVTSAVTEADGSFTIITLLKGVYRVEAGAAGYEAAVEENVVIVVGGTVDLGRLGLVAGPALP